MTRQQAIEALRDAAVDAILESAGVHAALAALDQLGVMTDAIGIRVNLTVQPLEGPSDEDFLRRLRIDPNLEVSPE
jgi:hypothetical protein